MNSKKLFLKSLVLACGLSCVQAQEMSVRISGRIQGLGSQEIRIVDPVKGEVAKTFATQDSFSFEASINVEDQRFYTLHIPALGKLGPSMKRPAISFIAGPDAIRINATIEDGSLRDEKIIGSRAMDDFKAIYHKLATTKMLDEASKIYNKAFHDYNTVAQTEENLKVLKEEGRKVDAIYKLQHAEIMETVAGNNNSLTLATLAAQYCRPQSNKEALTEFLSKFGDDVKKKSFYLLDLQADLNKHSQIEVGKLAPDFELHQLDGKVVQLKSFKGKYVLLDFWASWCGPCRREMPHVKSAHAQFKDKNFEVFAVSIDRDKAMWEKALLEDNMPFVHVLDKEGEQSAKALYMVQAIPTNFLIDPNGKIIAKNLRGEELTRFLNTTL